MTLSPNSREWNAAEYHRLSDPQFQWGQRVLKGLQLRGDERVLDAGCGTGRLTRVLLENLPEGRAVGVDLSRNMVAHAQRNLQPDFGGRAQFVAADLVRLPFQESFDGIFSTASFHWVLDHELLFRNLFEALRPGGWLLGQCGGGPNLKRLRDRVRDLSDTREFTEWLGTFPEPWFFSDTEECRINLLAAGFHEIETSLESAPVAVTSSVQFEEYLRTFVLHRHLELMPNTGFRERFTWQLAEAAAEDDPPWTLDYWRLNLRARRSL